MLVVVWLPDDIRRSRALYDVSGWPMTPEQEIYRARLNNELRRDNSCLTQIFSKFKLVKQRHGGSLKCYACV